MRTPVFAGGDATFPHAGDPIGDDEGSVGRPPPVANAGEDDEDGRSPHPQERRVRSEAPKVSQLEHRAWTTMTPKSLVRMERWYSLCRRLLVEIDAAYLFAWMRAFAFTEIVEAPIYRFLGPVRWWRGLLPSAITHPFVWFAFPLLSTALGTSWTLAMVLAEVFAWVVEAGFLVATRPRVPPLRATVVSLLANAASLGLGLLSRHFWGYP